MIEKLVFYPSPLLRAPKLRPLPPAVHSPALRKTITTLRDTMYAHEAIGLAAPQIGVLERVFVLDGKLRPEAAGDPPPLVFVNPKIVAIHGTVRMTEGCLSLPSAFLPVERAREVQVVAEDAEGEPFELTANGLLARAILHEHDHLEGILMIDHVDVFLRERAQRQTQKWRSDRSV